MMLKYLCVAVPASLLILGNVAAHAGQTINDAGAIVCVNDKWDEKEVEKGHKLVDAVQRCVTVPTDATAEKVAEDCVGKYEYMPDGSWKGSGRAPTPVKAESYSIHGKRVRTSRNTLTRSPAAPTNTKALVAAARTSTTISPTLWLRAPSKVR